MMRWEEPDPRRLRQQEKALLALCDRVIVLEQALTAEIEAHRLTRKRLDLLQEQLNGQRARLGQTRRDHRILFDILGREE